MKSTCLFLFGPVIGNGEEISVGEEGQLWDEQINKRDPWDGARCEYERQFTHVEHVRDDEAALIADSPVLRDRSIDIKQAHEVEVVLDEDGTQWVLLTLPISAKFAA